MSGLTADIDVTRKEGGLQSYPVTASEIIYKGAMVGIDADGYLNAMGTALALRFVGIAAEKKDNDSGLDAALWCRVYTEGVFLLTATSIAQTMVGQPMFCTDDQTLDDTGTNYQYCGVLVEYVSATSGWVDIGKPRPLRGIAADLHILTDTDGKNVRIQSRDFLATSGEHSMIQVKPNVSVGGTTGITAIEVSPRFASGIAGSKIVGIFSNPDLKGAAGGNLSSAMRCFEGKLESASGSTRTLAEAYVLHCMNALHGTVTTGPYAICVDTAGGNVAWAGFAKLPDDDAIANDEDTGAANTITGYIKVLVGSATRYIYLYTLIPSG